MSKQHDRMKQIRLLPDTVRRLDSYRKNNPYTARIPVLVNYAVNFWLDRQMEKEPK